MSGRVGNGDFVPYYMHDFHPLPHKGVQYTRFVRERSFHPLLDKKECDVQQNIEHSVYSPREGNGAFIPCMMIKECDVQQNIEHSVYSLREGNGAFIPCFVKRVRCATKY
jgi:hypothetical protein